MQEGLPEETSLELIVKWGEETGEMIYKSGAPLEEALKNSRYYSAYLLKTVQEEVRSNYNSDETII